MSNKSIHALVEGVVQGVGYRYFVLKTAGSLGLGGWVRNLPDGRVETYAEGNQEDLKHLIAQLQKGPWSARVDRVEVEWGDFSGSHGQFTVRF